MRPRLRPGDGAACYQHGVATEKDLETDGEAHRMYRKACDLGVAIGCTNFAADLWATNDYASVACADGSSEDVRGRRRMGVRDARTFAD